MGRGEEEVKPFRVSGSSVFDRGYGIDQFSVSLKGIRLGTDL